MATTEAAIETKRSNERTAPERIVQDGMYYTPAVDIFETADAFLFHADVPGVNAEDVDISCANGEINIRARVQPRQPAEQRYLGCEYGVGDFHRSFAIDFPVRAEAIKAELKQGVLTLTVPKAESAKTRTIQIKQE